MDIDQSIFKSYDIRGVYPQQINEKNYPQIIRAVYTYFLEYLKKDNISIVVGRDMRLSGPALSKIAIRELVSLGAHVIDAGLVSTPSLYFACFHYGYDAGIQISASHNPPQYTGIKFVIRQGKMLVKLAKGSGMERIQELSKSTQLAPARAGGKVEVNDHILRDEVAETLKMVDVKKLKPFKVVADPGNGMAALYLTELFKHIPGELVRMNFELDGSFPVHIPNPIVFETLRELQKRVVAEKADLGIAPDGDGDRIYFIDEKGGVIKATSITTLIAHEILKQEKGAGIIADIRAIRNVQEVCTKLGGKFHMSIVGHSHITRQLNAVKAAFAGESSGHFYFRENGGAESALRVALYVLKAMSEQGEPISAITQKYVTSYESEEVNFTVSPPADPKKILGEIEKGYGDGHVYKDDGLSVDYPDWRFNIRQSNTENEPILRVNVEGANRELVESKFAQISKSMVALGATLK